MFEVLRDLIAQASGTDSFQLGVPEFEKLGHFMTNVAFAVGNRDKIGPMEAARRLEKEILTRSPKNFIDRIDVAAPGFINFWLTPQAIQTELSFIFKDKQYGLGKSWKGKRVMIEFTDPNPFKLFHIGHLMSNTIGESFARLFEAAGAKVIRANYQGDVGLHVAKAIWGMRQMIERGDKMPSDYCRQITKVDFLGRAYALGASVYEDQSGSARPEAKEEILAINEKVYSRRDKSINQLYDIGRKWSLAYFETVYKKLGTKFNHYFFESKVGRDGLKLVMAHQDIFEESQGAIVFPGEKYGLHTRVFVNSKGLPTYEAKELGLNKRKFELYKLDLSAIVTANEINDYFKVLLKVMSLIMPEVARKTRHVSHGFLRLPGGKMSSRTGSVITAESLIEQVKEKIRERVGRNGDISGKDKEVITEAIAIGAIKCSILRQSPGQDIIFDFERSLSLEGDSGPYLQYAFVRALNILNKAGRISKVNYELLDSGEELALIMKLIEFPTVIKTCIDSLASNGLVTYLYDLAKTMNRFYDAKNVLKAEDKVRRARLA
ncbi:MAG: arginine--tRNA ligase, partial [Patescibacteria group bacterium]|nr:arginine--tRNA ligase [Patescibacteria group bacterium]